MRREMVSRKILILNHFNKDHLRRFHADNGCLEVADNQLRHSHKASSGLVAVFEPCIDVHSGSCLGKLMGSLDPLEFGSKD